MRKSLFVTVEFPYLFNKTDKIRIVSADYTSSVSQPFRDTPVSESHQWVLLPQLRGKLVSVPFSQVQQCEED